MHKSVLHAYSHTQPNFGNKLVTSIGVRQPSDREIAERNQDPRAPENMLSFLGVDYPPIEMRITPQYYFEQQGKPQLPYNCKIVVLERGFDNKGNMYEAAIVSAAAAKMLHDMSKIENEAAKIEGRCGLRDRSLEEITTEAEIDHERGVGSVNLVVLLNKRYPVSVGSVALVDKDSSHGRGPKYEGVEAENQIHLKMATTLPEYRGHKTQGGKTFIQVLKDYRYAIGYFSGREEFMLKTNMPTVQKAYKKDGFVEGAEPFLLDEADPSKPEYIPGLPEDQHHLHTLVNTRGNVRAYLEQNRPDLVEKLDAHAQGNHPAVFENSAWQRRGNSRIYTHS